LAVNESLEEVGVYKCEFSHALGKQE
jgi:hypothetical protein